MEMESNKERLQQAVTKQNEKQFSQAFSIPFSPGPIK
jgi:hypothetical protein